MEHATYEEGDVIVASLDHVRMAHAKLGSQSTKQAATLENVLADQAWQRNYLAVICRIIPNPESDHFLCVIALLCDIVPEGSLDSRRIDLTSSEITDLQPQMAFVYLPYATGLKIQDLHNDISEANKGPDLSRLVDQYLPLGRQWYGNYCHNNQGREKLAAAMEILEKSSPISLCFLKSAKIDQEARHIIVECNPDYVKQELTMLDKVLEHCTRTWAGSAMHLAGTIKFPDALVTLAELLLGRYPTGQ